MHFFATMASGDVALFNKKNHGTRYYEYGVLCKVELDIHNIEFFAILFFKK